jgi:hypothetical protein
MENRILSIIKRNIDKTGGLTSYERAGFEKILHCRSEPVPHLYQCCDNCHSVHPVFKSCKNRMCPVCNGASRIKWLAKRDAELLPVGYFLLTYTIPRELRSLFLSNKKICYNLLFKAVSRSLIECVKNNKRAMKGKAGFFAVLHTWDQRLNYHPHIHIVIPGGCLSADKSKWNPSNPSFLLPISKLSADFKDKLLLYLRKEEKAGKLRIPKEILNPESLLDFLKTIKWVVNSQPPGKGKTKPEFILRYLSRYVNKTAVSDNRIRKTENGKVYLEYFDRKRKVRKTEILSEELFMKRLVFHFLPKDFKRIRFYGFMANRYRASMLVLCRMLLGQSLSEQEEDKTFIEDVAFLFWKYFRVDISLCPDCGVGHVSIIRGYAEGG